MGLKIILRKVLLHLWLLFYGVVSVNGNTSEIVLVGCTPGDEDVKSALSIPLETKIDFIRWNLTLASPNTFVLDIVFGESQPNTLGFKGGGEKLSIKGLYSHSKLTLNSSFKEVYCLKNPGLHRNILLAKLSENIFHVLTPQNQLMIGNGGWSYTLSRKTPVCPNNILISSNILNNKPLQVIFDGRTPSRDIAAEHPEMKVSNSSFKLKWRLILYRDSVTLLPSTYTIRKVVNGQVRSISGKWIEIKGTDTNPDVVIYKIEPDKPDESISFLVGDGNILFFLNKRNLPYVGNENFSYTLNRKL